MDDLVFAIDTDVRRRASISYLLNRRGIFAEPFETVQEFVVSFPKSGIILVHDDGKAAPLLMQEMSSRHRWMPIVAYSENPEPSRIVQTVVDGAIGYAAWPGCDATLIKTLETAATRSVAEISRGSRQALATAQIEKLSPREREILAGMVEGLSNRLIGEQLAISPRTVELHRANLLAKIEAKHSADAIRLAIEASLPSFQPAPGPIARKILRAA